MTEPSSAGPNPPDTIICYAIPGLGATSELFASIDLPDWIEIRPLAWDPCLPFESLADYSGRLLSQVDTARPHFYLGFSFGAAIAVELALHTNPLLTVLVSGVAKRSEVPFYLRRARAFGVYSLAPWVVRLWEPLLRWGAGVAFGTRDPAAKDMLVRMIRSIDPSFYECGLKSFMSWKNETAVEPVLHIHGRRDLLLPLRYLEADVVVPDGGHFIIYTHGPLISRLIIERLETLRPEMQHLES